MFRNELSKNMQKFLDSLYYSEFLKYRTPYEKAHDELSSKADHYGLYTKLSRCLSWKSYKNLRSVVTYLGWEGAFPEHYSFDIYECMETAEGCKKLIMEDIKHNKKMYEKLGY